MERNHDRTDFRDFIRQLLRRSNLNSKSTEKLLDRECMSVFEDSFTHSSHRRGGGDYETLEFVGDLTLNMAIGFIIAERYPGASPKQMGNLQRYLKQKRVVGKVGIDMGFDQFVMYGSKMVDAIEENVNLVYNESYISMMEDVVEAFLGAVGDVIVLKGYSSGVAWNICNNLVSLMFENVEMDINYVDGITLLKESVFDKFKSWGDINKKGGIVMVQRNVLTNEKGYNYITFTAMIFGFPDSPKWKANPKNRMDSRVLLAELTGGFETKVVQDACMLALENLRENYDLDKAIEQYSHA